MVVAVGISANAWPTYLRDLSLGCVALNTRWQQVLSSN